MLLFDMSRPAPLEDFLLPHSGELRFEDVRSCYLGDGGELRKVLCSC